MASSPDSQELQVSDAAAAVGICLTGFQYFCRVTGDTLPRYMNRTKPDFKGLIALSIKDRPSTVTAQSTPTTVPVNTSISAYILVIDNDRFVPVALSLGLQRAGYRVSAADSAEEAEHLLAAGINPDLALLDISMPGSSGLELAQRLHLCDLIPSVFLSAYRDAATGEYASTCEALSHLVKPIDLAQRSPAIATALARASELRNLNRELQQLQKILDGERSISVAVGITMIQRQLGRDAAFSASRSAARAQRVKFAHVAAEVIRAHENHSSASVVAEN